MKLIKLILAGLLLSNLANAEINIAIKAQASASSTFCSGENPSLHCYDAARVNDGDTSTTLGGDTSWTNNSSASAPHWWQATWPSIVKISHATVFTSDQAYAIRDFDLQYYDWYNDEWRTIQEIRNNTSLSIDINFSPVYSDKLRVWCLKGPSIQPDFVRLNEVVVIGKADHI